jgi:ribosome-binding factor A
MSRHTERLSEQLQHLAAMFVARESNRTSLITITRCELSENQKCATIFMSVFPTDNEKTAEEFVKRKRTEFVKYVHDNSKIGRLPTISFKIDLGEKNRQRLDELSQTEMTK